MDALGHDMGEWTTVIKATCTENGSEKRDCTRCDYTENRVIEAIGHDYEAVVTAPACTEQGYTTHTCADCGDSYVDTYMEALGHDMGEWMTVTEATCTVNGTEKRICSRCDHTEIRVVEATGHSFGSWFVNRNATCTKDGENRRNCAKCGHFETEVIPAIGHDYESVVTAPTCTEQGYTTHTCRNCGDSYLDADVDALGHDMGEWATVTEATCTVNGSETRDCSRCDHIETRVIEAIGHNYESAVTAPSCTERGYTTHTCSNCGDSFVDAYVDALGHDMGEWTTITEVTCTENGAEKRDCSRCDHIETRVIEAIGHNYESAVTAPSCTEQGYTTSTCTNCGDSYLNTYVDALGHDYEVVIVEPACTEDGMKTQTCTRCGDVVEEILPGGHEYVDGVCVRCGEAAGIIDSGWSGGTQWILTVDGTLTIYGSGNMRNNYQPWLNKGVDITTVIVEDGVKHIGTRAFEELTSLKSVALPDSLTSIGYEAFEYCTMLDTITFPENLTSIGASAFYGCVTLDTIIFLGGVPTVKSNTFYGVDAAAWYPAEEESWELDAMMSIGETLNWFGYSDAPVVATGWSGYTTWELTEDGVLIFSGEGAMKTYGSKTEMPWCQHLDKITCVVLNPGVTTVSDYAFYGAPNLRRVILSNTVTVIGTYAFKGCTALEQVYLPASLTKISEAAFYGCTSLKEITIPKGIYTIWAYTFKGCTALESVKLPKALIKIDQGAFENCTALASVYIPGDTQIIGSWSFKSCTSLTEVDMTWADATEIREGAFKNCTALAAIYLPADIRKFGDSAFYGIGAESFTVPETVTEIGPWCFARANVGEIIFEGDAPTIGEGAFNKIALTAYYPGGNATWTTANKLNYGGTISWLAQ